MKWPDAPTCHSDTRGSPLTWLGAGERPFRSCSWCGSVHPEDLLTLLGGGAELSGADWKYGWPHKFYVSAKGTGGTKWYNHHIADKGFDDEARTALLTALCGSGIRFFLKDGKINYSAPKVGYQRQPSWSTLPRVP